MIKKIKERTGVIMKIIGQKDGENGLKVLIGGKRSGILCSYFMVLYC